MDTQPQHSKLKTYSLIIVLGLLCGVLGVMAISVFTKSATTTTKAQSVAAAEPSFPAAAAPERLIIPSLNVNVPILAVGLTPQGSMDVAHSDEEVGWYKYGPYPGSPGTAVIAGHLDTKLNPTAVFYNLDKLKPGDEVDVTENNSTTVKFVVTGSKVYGYQDSTASVFESATPGNFLNLITCAGTWMPNISLYNERLVVFTKRIE